MKFVLRITIESIFQVVAGRDILINKDKQLQEEYKDEQIIIPKPDCWWVYCCDNTVPWLDLWCFKL